MRTAKIIAIEGMPGAGKSTSLIRNIHRFGRCTHLLPETNPIPSQLKIENDFYLKIWVERMDLISDTAFEKHSFILDRSFYSNLAYIYATESTKYFTKYANNMMKTMAEFEEIQKIFLLDVDPQVGIERKLTANDIIPSPWNGVKFLKKLRQFYHQVIGDFYHGQIHLIKPNELANRLLAEFGGGVKKNISPISKEISKMGDKFSLGNETSKIIAYPKQKICYYRAYAIVKPDNDAAKFFSNADMYGFLDDK